MKRIVELDFIRAFCAIGIVCYHYSGESASSFKLFHMCAAGTWGDVFVTAFFLMSGFVLEYNYGVISWSGIRDFYYKRWKSIFPMFYIAFFFFYIRNVLGFKNVFYKGIPKLMLTIMGMDGYFYYLGDNYYILGEWFLGGVIILYILYPLLAFLLNKSNWFTLVIIISYLLTVYFDCFKVGQFRNILSCMVSFVVGMWLVKVYEDYGFGKSYITYVAVLVSVFLIFVKITDTRAIQFVLEHVLGTTLFITLFAIAGMISRFGIYKVISEIGRISYPIFLLQHIVILEIQRVWNPIAPVNSMILLGIIIVLILLYAEALDAVHYRVIKCLHI